jgi:hypothetical protein
MGKGSGKRATRKRVADVSAATREDDAQLKRATTRRLAKLAKDLAAAHKTEERHRSRLAEASAEADHIRLEIAGLVRHASEPAIGGARKVGHAAGGVAHAAGSVVGAARRAVRTKPAPATAPVRAKPATPRQRRARPTTPPASGPDDA